MQIVLNNVKKKARNIKKCKLLLTSQGCLLRREFKGWPKEVDSRMSWS
jgi:hypothetical protein